MAPGSGAVIGTRWPLIHAVERALRRPLEESSSSSALWLAQRLAASPFREVRLFSLPCLERSLRDDPERSWQLHAPPRPRRPGLDQRRQPRLGLRAGHPAGAVPLGGTRAARLLDAARWSAAWSARPWRACRYEIHAAGRSPRPRRGSRARADRRFSWATPTTRSRRPSAGRCGSGAAWIAAPSRRSCSIARPDRGCAGRRRPPRLGDPRFARAGRSPRGVGARAHGWPASARSGASPSTSEAATGRRRASRLRCDMADVRRSRSRVSASHGGRA